MSPSVPLTMFLSMLLYLSQTAFGQDGDKHSRFFSQPILTDSVSTLMIPLTYSTDLFASNKMLSWGNYYANIIVYNFTADSYTRLFDEDTFIAAFDLEPHLPHSNPRGPRLKNFSRDWIFYLVKSSDFNGNGKLDEKDPNVLFVTNRKGEGLKPLSPPNENVIAINVYDKQGFALVKMQRDANHDKDFKSEDKDSYLVKINLSSLQWGNKIEIGSAEMN